MKTAKDYLADVVQLHLQDIDRITRQLEEERDRVENLEGLLISERAFVAELQALLDTLP